ncbi:hypothetical protein CYMTET_46724, partial [Cymbomonas tetramitiformis]
VDNVFQVLRLSSPCVLAGSPETLHIYGHFLEGAQVTVRLQGHGEIPVSVEGPVPVAADAGPNGTSQLLVGLPALRSTGLLVIEVAYKACVLSFPVLVTSSPEVCDELLEAELMLDTGAQNDPNVLPNLKQEFYDLISTMAVVLGRPSRTAWSIQQMPALPILPLLSAVCNGWSGTVQALLNEYRAAEEEAESSGGRVQPRPESAPSLIFLACQWNRQQVLELLLKDRIEHLEEPESSRSGLLADWIGTPFGNCGLKGLRPLHLASLLNDGGRILQLLTNSREGIHAFFTCRSADGLTPAQFCQQAGNGWEEEVKTKFQSAIRTIVTSCTERLQEGYCSLEMNLESIADSLDNFHKQPENKLQETFHGLSQLDSQKLEQARAVMLVASSVLDVAIKDNPEHRSLMEEDEVTEANAKEANAKEANAKEVLSLEQWKKKTQECQEDWASVKVPPRPRPPSASKKRESTSSSKMGWEPDTESSFEKWIEEEPEPVQPWSNDMVPPRPRPRTVSFSNATAARDKKSKWSSRIVRAFGPFKDDDVEAEYLATLAASKYYADRNITLVIFICLVVLSAQPRLLAQSDFFRLDPQTLTLVGSCAAVMLILFLYQSSCQWYYVQNRSLHLLVAHSVVAALQVLIPTESGPSLVRLILMLCYIDAFVVPFRNRIKFQAITLATVLYVTNDQAIIFHCAQVSIVNLLISFRHEVWSRTSYAKDQLDQFSRHLWDKES